MAKKKEGKKGRKIGRSSRKAAGRGKPLSLYVRGKITFAQYWAAAKGK